jgi:hypothetical protein
MSPQRMNPALVLAHQKIVTRGLFQQRFIGGEIAAKAGTFQLQMRSVLVPDGEQA